MGVLRAGLCPGLTQDMAQLLRSRGIKTVVDLVSADLEEVAQKCGLSYKALVALRRVLLAQLSAFPFNGADLYEELKTSTAILSTGIASLDKLLDAGLYTGEVTEIVGGPGMSSCGCKRGPWPAAERPIHRFHWRAHSFPHSPATSGQNPRGGGAGDQFFRDSEGGGCGLGHCGGRPTSGRSAEGRLGLDDAAGPRAEDSGPGPQRGTGGDQSHDPRQGQRAAQTCPGTLLELCAQHPASPGHRPRCRSIRQLAHGMSDQISPSANRFPGDGGHWDLGDSSAEPNITGRSHVTCC
ncbi:DNA repair protein RAD51 homolog 4 isoform X3 [Neophocaena asiaeorientalis asiaeorientalis]|uniref:DNA repair protein RAD51 homolog 4 isoform X3 n=1 Tax=Neophocaena asiaeorientalis asiaeorientalis TaxID=1706337 RepID=A0A341ABV5_NEOAA|nr:DNA repair protein RAD51 homolog 4 isoform X3 [Neophocaena asiaeorientalis asiaeorientalis]XP_032473029.1 DNA repair protein RAD51 homolog 4 isoform X3 [Phocoena sinus]